MTNLPPFAIKARDMTMREIVIWFTTTSRNLSPQPRPVWFIWYEEHFLIYSRPNTHKVRHIQERPNVALHFNSDRLANHDVVMFNGVARIAKDIPPAHEIPTYVEKYKESIKALDMSPQEFGESYSVPILIDVKDLEGLA